MNSKRLPATIGVAALLLLAGSCGSADEDAAVQLDSADGAEVADGVEAAESDGPSGPVLDASVLTGKATTVDGEPFDLATVANKDLVVWFWAPW